MSVTPVRPVLVQVKEKIEKALRNPEVTTADFVDLCHSIISVFDNLGTIFCFAKKEFSLKNASLQEAKGRFKTLRELVNHDKENNCVATKNSRARNLHRLASALTFITKLMQELTRSTAVQLKDAAHSAYETALAPIHTKLVKSVVIAGLLALPSRATFLENINETDESAKTGTIALLPLGKQLVQHIESLYDEPMPVSNTWFISY